MVARIVGFDVSVTSVLVCPTNLEGKVVPTSLFSFCVDVLLVVDCLRMFAVLELLDTVDAQRRCVCTTFSFAPFLSASSCKSSANSASGNEPKDAVETLDVEEAIEVEEDVDIEAEVEVEVKVDVDVELFALVWAFDWFVLGV